MKDTKIPLFRRWVLQNFPFIEQDFDALTDYQLISKVVEYLNKCIETVNASTEQIEVLTNAFNQLKDYVDHYFDNLDVQEEINNKLDGMVEDGTLQEIITTYIQSNVAWTFDTVADMKLSTNFVNGSYARTLGFHSINDGGGALYKITNTGTANEMDVIAIDNLFAHLIVSTEVTPEQFGAKGDGTTDDQDAINLCLASNAGIINFSKAKNYAIRGYETGQPEGGSTEALTGNTGLVIPSNKIINLNNSTIVVLPNSRQNYNGFTLASVSNVVIKNGKIAGDRQTHTGVTGEWGYGVSIRYGSNIRLENLHISECWGDGININNDGDYNTLCKNIVVDNCICKSNRRQGMSIENGENIEITNSQFIDTGDDSLHTNPSAGIDIEPYENSGNTVKHVKIDNCILSNNYGAGLTVSGRHTSGAKVDGLLVTNCNIQNNEVGSSNAGSLMILQALNVVISNNRINRADNVDTTIILRPANELIFDSNKVHNAKILSRCDYLNKSSFKFSNNLFTRSKNMQWNACLEFLDITSENNNNEVYVENNQFIGATPTTNLIQSWILANINAKITKVTITNNIFKFGRRAIEGNSSFVVRNNNFIAQYDYTIYLKTGNTSQITELTDNLFEGSNYSVAEAGLIQNTSRINTILQNNNYVNTLLNGESLTITNSPTRMLQYSDVTGIAVESNNNFSTIS